MQNMQDTNKVKKLYGLMRNIPKAKYSHNAAWARVWAQLVGGEVHDTFPDYDCDIAYIYIDINYNGSFNLFDGVSEDIYKRLKNFLDFDGKIYILEHDMPDVGKVIKSRINNPSTYKEVTEEFCDDLTEKCKNIESIYMQDFISDKLVIGDSHSISIAPEKTPIRRMDAKTLFGALKGSYLDDLIPDTVKELTLMFGSIDIRHHLLRQDNPKEATRKLIDNYISKINEFQKRGISVSVGTPVPVETEDRKMAKTTMYKGTPFYGSREERLELTYFFISYLEEKAKEHNIVVIKYPDLWYKMDPLDFEKQIMERPRGIHIGWPNYRMNNFGVINNLDDW